MTSGERGAVVPSVDGTVAGACPTFVHAAELRMRASTIRNHFGNTITCPNGMPAFCPFAQAPVTPPTLPVVSVLTNPKPEDS